LVTWAVVALASIGGGTITAQAPARLIVDTTASHEGFGLLPGTGFPASLQGRVTMRQPWSPFGVSVSEQGELLHQLSIDAESLPPLTGDDRYVVWLATPTLDSVAALGTLVPGTPVRAMTGLAQMLVVVTRESGPPGPRWRGPIVLRGRSRSALIQSLLTHPIFRRAEMD